MLTVCFIDTLGLAYDGSTLSKRGLGGSESATIHMARELANLGFKVKVFNDCIADDNNPGFYDGVEYLYLDEIEKEHGFDIYIGVRAVAAFAPNHLKDRFKIFHGSLPNFEKVHANSKYRILYMHDTFCDGDDLIEPFITEGRIDKLFTLSDWHTTYIMNNSHSEQRRNFEVLKPHIWQTRNGVQIYRDWVDISAKDPDLFIYNSSLTKGMVNLVDQVWPKVKAQIPQAKLVIIGGFYRFRSEHGPDEQELRWREYYEKYEGHLDMHFTGVIKQDEIADWLSKASFMLYPAAFPETFGISALESQVYNTPLLTCRFGALEETAVEEACYKINYAIEPNGLFPLIDNPSQVEKFVEMTVQAHANKYLHQQKMYACNVVKEGCTWADVALQWKQHLYKHFDQYLPVEEFRKVSHINYHVSKIFNRRYSTPEMIGAPKMSSEIFINVIVPVYNAESYIAKCVASVLAQDYESYHIYLIDDASTDLTAKICQSIANRYSNKVSLIRNKENMGAVYNQITTIRSHCQPGTMTMLLDGDDWLVNDPTIFNMYNSIYQQGADYTYGSCWSLADNIPLIAQPYPEEVKRNKSYRQHLFNWNMPYPHLRTFASNLVHTLDDAVFKDSNGNWFQAGGDNATFYNIIEQADPDRVICIPSVVYVYNDTNPLNDYKVNGEEQNKTANSIVQKQHDRLLNLSNMDLLPVSSKNKMAELKLSGFNPKVIYDIGSSVLHWYKEAVKVWPNATYYEFEAIAEVQELYNNYNIHYSLGPLSDVDGKKVTFYQNLEHPGGSSYYKEVGHPNSANLYPESQAVTKYTRSLDSIVAQQNWPKPDLIKIDVQGAELDVLKGAKNTLANCEHLIVELQFVHYNEGAPLYTEVVEFLESLGFTNHGPFSEGMMLAGGSVDSDFHFSKKKETNMNTKQYLENEYMLAKNTESDINQHIETLYNYAMKSETIAEFGVRQGWSTRSFLHSGKKLRSYDLYLDERVSELFRLAQSQGIDCMYQVADTRTLDIEPVDMLFIDTDHTYSQLSAELKKHHSKVNKYIAFHDTFTFGLRENNQNAKGLISAIMEFMQEHPEWKIDYYTTENNGLTVLKKHKQTTSKPLFDHKTEDRFVEINNLKKFTVTAPVMWKCQELFYRALHDYCNHELIDEIIIINNNKEETPNWDILSHDKITMYYMPENIYVNPAWNLGVKLAKNDCVCIVNDDIKFDLNVLYRLQDKLTPENGAFGIIAGEAQFNQPLSTDFSIDFINWKPGDIIHNFGQAMFIHKDTWTPIIPELQMYYGDDFIIHTNLEAKRNIGMIYNIKWESPLAATTSLMSEEERLDWHNREQGHYQAWASQHPIDMSFLNVPKANKRILIGIPTAKNIESETFKSLYDLQVPEGYETELQFFYGYTIDQVRNLIADWAKSYDYLLSVDSDIVLPNDALVKMLNHDVDMISGVYMQRLHDKQVLELYKSNEQGGVTNMSAEEISPPGLHQITGCGFGAVLIKSDVIRSMEYPHFEYKSALSHAHTFSEDVYFCQKAIAAGAKIFVDSTIICEHIGARKFIPDLNA